MRGGQQQWWKWVNALIADGTRNSHTSSAARVILFDVDGQGSTQVVNHERARAATFEVDALRKSTGTHRESGDQPLALCVLYRVFAQSRWMQSASRAQRMRPASNVR